MGPLPGRSKKPISLWWTICCGLVFDGDSIGIQRGLLNGVVPLIWAVEPSHAPRCDRGGLDTADGAQDRPFVGFGGAHTNGIRRGRAGDDIRVGPVGEPAVLEFAHAYRRRLIAGIDIGRVVAEGETVHELNVMWSVAQCEGNRCFPFRIFRRGKSMTERGDWHATNGGASRAGVIVAEVA